MEGPWRESWKLDMETGGGPLLAQGCHLVDLICTFHRTPPVLVYAEGGSFIHRRNGLIDTAVATVRFASGSCASLILGDAGASLVTSHFFCELFGGTQSVSLYDKCFKAVFWQKEPALRWEEDERILCKSGDYTKEAFRKELSLFFGAIRGECVLPFSVENDITSTLVIEAIFDAIRTGRSRKITL